MSARGWVMSAPERLRKHSERIKAGRAIFALELDFVPPVATSPASTSKGSALCRFPDPCDSVCEARAGMNADQGQFQAHSGIPILRCRGSKSSAPASQSVSNASNMKVTQKSRRTARFRRYELVSVCGNLAMEAPFLPPVSAGLFWCLVFCVPSQDVRHQKGAFQLLTDAVEKVVDDLTKLFRWKIVGFFQQERPQADNNLLICCISCALLCCSLGALVVGNRKGNGPCLH